MQITILSRNNINYQYMEFQPFIYTKDATEVKW